MKTAVSAIELDHCREVALKTGGLFEFTSRYLPANRYEEYLALYAIVTLVRSIPVASVDDSVKWAQLKWWMDELAPESDSVTRHPVLRALSASGARAKLDSGKLQRLVTDALMSVDIVPDSDEVGLYERLASSGSTAIELELELDGISIDEQSLRNLGAASGLYGVLCGFTAAGTPYEQIPMNLLAKHNLSAVELQHKEHQAEFSAIIESLANTGLEWFSNGVTGLQGRAGQHLQLSLAMQRRRMTAMSKNAAKYFASNQAFGPSDAWFAWRFLRGLN